MFKTKKSFLLCLIAATALGWIAHDVATPWQIKAQKPLFASGDRLKAMNSVGRDGVLNGDIALFQARGDCLPHAKLVQLLPQGDWISAIYRCSHIVNEVPVIGELVVRLDRKNNFSGYAVGFAPAASNIPFGEIARLGPY